MLEAFVKFFVKWSEMKGSGSSAKLRKHDLLMLERSYFQHFWAKNGLLWSLRPQDFTYLQEILADTNLKTQIQSKSWVVYQVIDNQGWLLQYFGWLRMNRLHQPYLELITHRKVIKSSLWNMLCLWSETGINWGIHQGFQWWEWSWKSLHLYL